MEAPVSLPLTRAPGPRPGHVYLAGAGPGSPDLLTLRTLRLLQTATHIFPDDLVSPEILALANQTAEVTPVGKRCGNARVTQAEIHSLLIAAARAGGIVLRLKAGDPLIFGRASEEIVALQAADVPFDIVPGITAASAAAAALQVPLTDRTSASKLIFATAHHARNKGELDPDPQPLWRGPLPSDATLVIYMPGRDFEALAAQLVRAGIAPETPCAAISQVSTPAEHICSGTLGIMRSAHIGPSPVLLLIGRSLASSAARRP